MLRLQRLNMDTSWKLTWGGTSLVVDPWLVGSEVDGARWLNEQWHATPPVPVEEVGAFDAVVVSQSYADHCHFPTLDRLAEDRPILAVAKALAPLRARYAQREVRALDASPVRLGELEISTLAPDRRLDPVYYAALVERDGEAVVYTPHGFVPNDRQRQRLAALRVRVLVTTFMEFVLPWWLGGRVSPGVDNVRALADLMEPEFVINCHDEPKPTRGLVGRLASVTRTDPSTVKFPSSSVVDVDDYGAVTL